MATKPVKNGIITSTYEEHKKRSPQGSWGIDIGSVEKDPIDVVAAYECVVVFFGWSETFGNRIWTKVLSGTYKDVYIIYPHLSKIESSIKGLALIKEGDKIGEMGNTGLILINGKLIKNDGIIIPSPKGRHLHFEGRTRPDTSGKSIQLTEIEELYNIK